MRIFIIYVITLITTQITACGQENLSSQVNKNYCSITFLNVNLKYPLSVREAVKEYDLKYWSNGSFHNTLPFGSIASRNIPYNFSLVFSGNKSFEDVVPQENYADRIVKGYAFIFPASVDYDSLKTNISKHFRDKKFITKQKVYSEELKEFVHLLPTNLEIMEISPCIQLVLHKNIQSPSSLSWVVFYFDVTEAELLRFFH